MLDSSLINKNYPAVVFPVTKREIKSFSEATGQTGPLYSNENISKKKGRPSLLAPLTFLTVIDHKQKKPYQYIIDLGMDLGRILHAGQKYKYHHPIYSGDVITKRGKISNIYEKNNGDLQFVKSNHTILTREI
jgi:hypothetical protein